MTLLLFLFLLLTLLSSNFNFISFNFSAGMHFLVLLRDFFTSSVKAVVITKYFNSQLITVGVLSVNCSNKNC